MRQKPRQPLGSISFSKRERSPKNGRLPLPVVQRFALRRQRSKLVIILLLSVLVFFGSWPSNGFLRNGSLELWVGWGGYLLRSSLPDGMGRAYRQSVRREAARIPRLVMSKTLVGIDEDYALRELDADKRDHGGFNHTIEPDSGLPPSSAFKNLVVAKPSRDVRAALPQYRGRHCLSPYPLSACPFPGLCTPPESHSDTPIQPCAVWGTGKPSSLTRYLAGSTHGESAVFRADKAQIRDWDAPGRWVGDLYHLYGRYGRTRTQAGGDRDQHFFTPEQMHSCLRGKRIVVQGDSLLRQFFSRVVAYSRLLPTSCEHIFNWGTASYSVFANGSDAFEPSCPGRNCSFPEDALWTIIFDWHDENKPEENIKRWKDMKADAVVQGTVYWLGSDIDLVDVRNSIRNIFKDSSWKGAFSWFLSPEKTTDWYDQYDWRNGQMRELFAELRATGANANLLPIDRLARVNNGKRIVRNRRPITSKFDDVHFKCGFTDSDYPEPLKPSLQHLKAPTDWDARDMFNLNAVQLWLNGICDPA